MTPPRPEPAIVLFDGVCNLCNASVNFLLDRDPDGQFRFAALQSAAGQRHLERCGLPPDDLESFVLVEEGRCYRRSEAALRVARRLPGAWRLLYGLIILPPPVRDALYDVVARHRYRWFGRRDTCRLPTPEEQGRFL